MFISIETSTLSTLLIAIDRFIVMVLRPYQSIGLKRHQIIILMCACWGIGIGLPLSASASPANRVTNSACIMMGSSLHLSFTVLYASLNTIIFLKLIILYSFVLHRFLGHRNMKETLHVNRKAGSRLGLIILSNIVPWLTISVFTILVLAGVHFPPSLETILGLLLFPLNALLNPIINVLSLRSFLRMASNNILYLIQISKDIILRRTKEG